MFKLIKIQLEIFASLQTLFPPLKIGIFCRIVPLSLIKKLIKSQLEIFAPLQTLFFSLWKLTFSVASSPYFSLRIWNESSWKNFWTPANAVSPFENCHFLSHRPPARPRGILWVDTIGSPHRGILCVEKIGSVAPELQERPGTPSKPVKSTNGPFYWLTRKRAPPSCWTLSLDPVGGPL